MTRRPRRQQGFTLLEVLLVLTILVILGSTVTVFFSNAQRKANAKIALVQVKAVGQLLEEYHIDLGSYPTTSQGLAALRTAPGDIADTTKWGGPYAKADIAPDPWSRPYQYESTGDSFRVWSWGPDGQDGTEDDVSTE
ncbi:MAG: type II secretion system major pseudopilin GspG [Planctomycetota bacterium]